MRGTSFLDRTLRHFFRSKWESGYEEMLSRCACSLRMAGEGKKWEGSAKRERKDAGKSTQADLLPFAYASKSELWMAAHGKHEKQDMSQD